MASLIGQTLGQYKIISLLGTGGMATVYRAHQESIERDVAVKVIHPNLGELENFIQRFRREAKTIASLSHPHILKVFDYGQFQDMAYLVMELLTGGSLADLIRKGSLSLETTGKMLDQVASALDFAHQAGIIHRDLKPQNVLLDTHGNAFLSDFGIAKIVEGESPLTQSGAVMGTPSYMSPEQWSGQNVDSRTDVYALGIMLYEMLTGKLPFIGNTPFALMHQHIYETALSVNEVNDSVPPAVAEVVNRAIAKDRENRFSTAGELAAAYRAAISGAPLPDVKPKRPVAPPVRLDAPTIITPPTTPEKQPSSGSRLLIPGVLAVLIGVAALLFFLSRGQQSGGTTTPTTAATTAVAMVMSSATSTLPPTTAATNTPTLPPTETKLPTVTSTIDSEGTLNAIVQETATGIQRATQLAATISARLTQTEQAKPTHTYTPSKTPTETRTPTHTFTPSDTPTITLTPSDTNTPEPTNTPRPTNTPTLRPTATMSPTVSLGLAYMAFEFGGEGTGTGKFDDLRYITVDGDGNIYTGEYSSARIQKFDATGKYITSWKPEEKTPLRGLAADRNGNVYAVRGGKVHKFDSNGKLLRSFGGTFAFYDDVTVLPDGNLLVAATSASTDDIVKLNSTNGAEMQRLKKAIGSQSDQVELDVRIAVDGLGTVYALGSFNKSVFVFSSSGKFQTRFGEFKSPDAVTVDNQSNVFVSDFGEIEVFDKAGKPLGSIKIPNSQGFQTYINDRNELFVAARDRVYKLIVSIPDSK